MRWVFVLMVCVLAACSAQEDAAQVTRQQTPSDFSFAVQQVIPVASKLCSVSRSDGVCDFEVVVDDRAGRAPNAFQSLGADGQPVLTLTASLIAEAQNADEIALIVAHEAAHHIDGHLGQLNQDVARIKSMGAAANPEAINQGWARIDHKLRGFELDADMLGAKIALAAGFDPEKAAQILARLPAAPDHARATHPAHHQRLTAIRSVTQ